MTRTLIASASVCRRDGGGVQSFVLDAGRIASYDGCLTAPADFTIDAEGLTAAPGLIDYQINGGHGIDLTTDPSALWALGEYLPQYGVTAFLPTLITAPPEIASSGMAALRQRPLGYRGAEPLGLHLEGPMLNPDFRGAHLAEHLVLPGPEVIQGWSRRAGVAMVTLAPELPGAREVIETLRRRGVAVSAGHSGATAEDAIAGIAAGVTGVTHVLNAMAPIHHRESNLVTVALTNPTETVGLIVDGIHVDPVVVDLVWAAKGPERIALVSDAVAAAGAGEGSFALGDGLITASSDGVRRADGVLAGSTLTLIEAVRNLISYTSATKCEALRCASGIPSQLIGAPDRGSLDIGKVAEVVLLDDRLEVAATVCRGEIAFIAPNHTSRLQGDFTVPEA